MTKSIYLQVIHLLIASYVFFNFILKKVASSGAFYDELHLNISTSSIANTITGISSTVCISRCRRMKECKHAALRKLNTNPQECFLLRNTDPGQVAVTLLKEIVVPGNFRNSFTFNLFCRMFIN